ncbi:beta-ketoacyl-[acyl-carrier-protein] synthase family protein [Dactylosporangium sp. NBC_01737]|uniref:beta-ketoacyl-[acyl-carrier-protein] synthase family protein n=1 Tax=Dactylosporangium sp. NBC_01737 TaxID=2975959 RepID=UPI002E0E869D|nr:beta-ketoacyl-[acyl-carrier-protein] synthase family protein [Dactylosporangium sp. NBC_01737]
MRESQHGRRVVVTGLGVVAPCGTGLGNYWTGLTKHVEPAVVRRVLDLEPELYGVSRVQGRRMDRFTLLGLAAAAGALLDAGLIDRADAAGPLDGVDGERCATVFGTGIGGVMTWEPEARKRRDLGPRAVSPRMVPMVMPNAAPAAVALRWQLFGPSEAVATACASSTHAIAAAARAVATGRADLAVTGGAEACLADTPLAAFANMRALSATGVSRPFDVARDGFCASEGAGVLVIEEARHARARGAHVYAEIVGAGSSTDAYDMTAPAPGGVGAARCMRIALQDAGLCPQDVTHINAHGTSTVLNDLAEAQAIAAVFGRLRPAVTSVKGVTGHALGASGALEAVSLVLAYANRALPPTAGTVEVDPLIDLDVVLAPRLWEPAAAMSNSFAFGGHNATLVFAPAP